MTRIIAIDEVLDSSPAEIVSLDEIRKYLQIEDMVDGDTSSLLTSFRKTAITKVERFTGCSLQKKTITAFYEPKSARDYEELIKGPVHGTPTFTDIDATLIGTQFPKFTGTSDLQFSVQYQTGYAYTSVPEPLRTAIKKIIADLYFKRDDYGDGWKKDAKDYRRPEVMI